MNENEKAQREIAMRRPSALSNDQWANLIANAPSLDEMLNAKEQNR